MIVVLGGPRYATLETEIYNQAARLFDLRTAAVLGLLQLAAVAATVLVSGRLERRLGGARVAGPGGATRRRAASGSRSARSSLVLRRAARAPAARPGRALAPGRRRLRLRPLHRARPRDARAPRRAVACGPQLAPLRDRRDRDRAGGRDPGGGRRRRRAARARRAPHAPARARRRRCSASASCSRSPTRRSTFARRRGSSRSRRRSSRCRSSSARSSRRFGPSTSACGRPPRCSAPRPRQIRREIELPLLARPLAVAAGLAFAVALGEFGATVFVVRADWPTRAGGDLPLPRPARARTTSAPRWRSASS